MSDPGERSILSDPAPSAPEAEAALLGSLLLDDAIAREVAPGISPEDIFHGPFRILLGAIKKSLADHDSASVIPVLESLRASGGLDEIGGPDALAKLVSETPLASGAPLYARLVRDAAKRRRASHATLILNHTLRAGGVLNGEADAAIEAIKSLSSDDSEAAKHVDLVDALSLSLENIPPLDYLIEPFFPAKSLVMLQGDPKAGKSCFSLYAAIASASGTWTAGRWSVSRPRSVLYISWEDGKRRIRERTIQYSRGLGISPPPNLVVVPKESAPRIRLDKPEGPGRLRDLITRVGAEAVFLDTFSHLSGADENSKDKMQPVVDALTDTVRDLGTSIWINHHTGKASEKNPKPVAHRGRGSSVIGAAPDCILDFGTRKDNRTPCQMISRDDGTDEFTLLYDKSAQQEDGIVRWVIEEVAELENKYSARKKLLARVKIVTARLGRAASIAEIMEGFDEASEDSITKAIRRAVNGGYLSSESDPNSNRGAHLYAIKI